MAIKFRKFGNRLSYRNSLRRGHVYVAQSFILARVDVANCEAGSVFHHEMLTRSDLDPPRAGESAHARHAGPPNGKFRSETIGKPKCRTLGQGPAARCC